MKSVHFGIGIFQLLILLPCIFAARFLTSKANNKPRLLWSGTTIVSLAMNAKALRMEGYVSHSIGLKSANLIPPQGFTKIHTVTGSHNAILRFLAGNSLALLVFVKSLFQYDIMHFTFNGGLLNRTPLRNYEPFLLSLAGKKTVVFAYGSDAFAISRIPYKSWRDVLLADYPALGDADAGIAKRVDQFCMDATRIVGSLVHRVTLPKYDSLMLTCYPVDTEELQPIFPDKNGQSLSIFHAPNHRQIKGTEHLIEAVNKLRDEGFKVELELVERIPHNQVLERMKKCDLVIDQLNFGYGLTAMEGMALGKIVVSGKNPKEHNAPFQPLGLKDCPILWSTPDEIEKLLRDLMNNPVQWREIGKSSRKYVEKYHSYKVTAQNWISLYNDLC